MLVEQLKEAGDFKYTRIVGDSESTGLNFICPCGCKGRCHVSFKPTDDPHWSWNGNREFPTLSPSLLSPCWHGYLVDGVFVQCK